MSDNTRKIRPYGTEPVQIITEELPQEKKDQQQQPICIVMKKTAVPGKVRKK